MILYKAEHGSLKSMEYLPFGLYIMGIDPGINGAVCFIQVKKSYGENAYIFINPAEVYVSELPVFTKTINKTKRKVLSITALCDLLSRSSGAVIDKAFMEDVHCFPRDGAVSAFRFGESVGMLKSFLAISRIPSVFISPNIWKPVFRLNKAGKDESVVRLLELIPSLSPLFQKKKDHNKAEAILLCSLPFYTNKIND